MKKIKNIIRPICHYSGYPFLKIAYRRMINKKLIYILMYHRVDYRTEPFFEVAIKPDIFERHLRFLKKNYKLVDLKELLRYQSNKLISKDLVVITFDDGYRDNYLHAYPLLSKYGIPATIFLATGYIGTNRLLWYDKLAWILYKAKKKPTIDKCAKYGLPEDITRIINIFFNTEIYLRHYVLRKLSQLFKKLKKQTQEEILKNLFKLCHTKRMPFFEERPMLSWEEVRKMDSKMISFGSHTVTHPDLNKIEPVEAIREISESKKNIEEKIQKSVKTFAYPFGKKHHYNCHIFSILTQLGFELACTTNKGSEALPLRNPLELKRKGAVISPYLFY